MSDWKDELRDLAGDIAAKLRQAGNRLERVLDRDPYHVVGYRGYGSPGRILVQGRVLQDEGLQPADVAHSDWRNLLYALRRLESDPLPFARVRVRGNGWDRELVADDEGFFREWIPLPKPLSDGGWHPVHLELDGHEPALPGQTPAPILTPAPDAAFGVISDMDDTVLQSEVRSFLRAARLVLLENARTRLPFPGVAAFYRALHGVPAAGMGNPIFYVSSSPWNLYDVITDFLEAQQIPSGPLLLRDWDLGLSLRRHRNHKAALVHELLATYPKLPFILVGDSAQEDPEIYADLVQHYPGRILAVYVRNVKPHPERSAAIQSLATRVAAAGSSLVLADDTLAAARHAAEQGWIAADALTEIAADKRDDEGGAAKIDAPGLGPATGGPTVVVS